MRLVDYNRIRWQDRAHFFAISAQLMRQILIDCARRHNRKRGAGFERVSVEHIAARDQDPDLVALDDALNALQQFDPRKAKVVELRFFGALTVEEAAEVLKVSPMTVIRGWNNARAWLYRELAKGSVNGR
jgi:RNA polymerase sigma factor (TIGR02999 family)